MWRLTLPGSDVGTFGRALFVVSLLFCGSWISYGQTPSSPADARLVVRLVDASRQPVHDARVSVTRDGATPWRQTSDDDGRAVFSGVPAGPARVLVDADGFGPQVHDVTVPAAGPLVLEIALDLALEERLTVGAYRQPSSTTASKLDSVTAQETPFSAQFVPVRLIEDQQAQTVNDALRNVSGVTTQAGLGDLIPRQRIRGFVPPSQLKNGFRQNLLSTLTSLANVERVEVLKGPASALYGPFEPGGVINLITKTPTDQPFRRFELAGGSFSTYRATADLGGPLDAAHQWLYRLNVSVDDADSYRDFITNRSVLVAPVITWRASNRTVVTAEVEYLWRDGGFDRGFGNAEPLLDLPSERNLGEPIDFATYHGVSLRYDLRHQLTDHWQLRQATMISNAELDMLYHTPGFPALTGREYLRVPQSELDRQRDLIAQAEVSGAFHTGALDHVALVGVELGSDRNRFHFERGTPSTVNVDHPAYGADPGTFSPFSIGVFRTSGASVYLQDQVSIGPRLKVMAGGRFDAIESQSASSFSTFEPPFDRRRRTPTLSPRGGVTWLASEEVALYASVARSFRTDLFGTIVGGLPEPSDGRQVEAGVKASWLAGRLSATAAAFRLTKRKVLVADPGDPFGPSLQVGEQRATGVELDVAGDPWPGLSLQATYAATDATVTKDTTIDVGSRLANVPRHLGSLWATYQVIGGPARGLAFGVGIFASGAREAVLPSSFQLPGYQRVDALAAYRFSRYKVALNIANLTNERYVEAGSGLVPIYPQAPRSTTLSVGAVF